MTHVAWIIVLATALFVAIVAATVALAPLPGPSAAGVLAFATAAYLRCVVAAWRLWRLESH